MDHRSHIYKDIEVRKIKISTLKLRNFEILKLNYFKTQSIRKNIIDN